MKKYLLSFVCILFAHSIYAQNTMYFMEQMPQQQYYNPAFIPKMDFYLNLPGLNGFSFDAYNTGFKYGELTEHLDLINNDNYDSEEFINSLPETNSFQSEARVNLFGFGFRINDKSFISFNSTMNSSVKLNADSDIAYLLSEYNDIEEEKFPITVDGIDLQINSYMSIGINYIRKINEHLTIGINPTLNNNIAGIKTQNMLYKVDIESTDEYGNREYIETFKGEAVLGLPAEMDREIISRGEMNLEDGFLSDNWDEELKFSDIFANKNLSLNLGASYQLNKWLLSASLLNIGTAKWKRKAYRLKGNNDALFITEEIIKIGIPPKFYLGAARQFSPRWTYGMMLQNIFYPDKMHSSATLSLNGTVGRMLTTSFSYTAGYKFDNLGIGLRLRFFPGMDFYIVTDNLIQAFNYKGAYRMSGSAGINFSTGLKNYLKTPNRKLEETPEV